MAPQPTKTMEFSTGDADMNPDSFSIKADPQAKKPSVDLGKIGLAMFPLTPVPYKGEKSVWAYVRILVYGTAGYLAWSKARKLSMVMLSAAALSATTSATGTIWNGGKK